MSDSESIPINSSMPSSLAFSHTGGVVRFCSKYPPLTEMPKNSLAICMEEIFQRRGIAFHSTKNNFESAYLERGLRDSLNILFREHSSGLKAESISLAEVEAIGTALREKKDSHEKLVAWESDAIEALGKRGSFLPLFLAARLRNDDDILVQYFTKNNDLRYGLIESVDLVKKTETQKQVVQNNITIRVLELRPDRPPQHIVFSQAKLKSALTNPETGFVVIGKDTFSF